jgi:hypothetical protein
MPQLAPIRVRTVSETNATTPAATAAPAAAQDIAAATAYAAQLGSETHPEEDQKKVDDSACKCAIQ